MSERDDLAAALREQIRVRRQAKGLSQRQLADRLGYSREYLCKVESGASFPSAEIMEALDRALAASGELAELRTQAWRARQAERLGVSPVADGGGATNRRQVFELAAAGVLAAEAYRWHGTADAAPDTLTLDELEDAVARQAAARATTRHDLLAPAVFDTWQQAETALRGRTSLRTRRRLTVAAGNAADLLSQLAFNLGDSATSRRFASLAARHAADADDTVLAASGAGMRTTLAFYAGRYAQAAREAGEGAARWGHPYTRAALAAYEARAHAALGNENAARAALGRMRRDSVELPVQPGMTAFGPEQAEMFLGGVLARLGHGDEAEPFARAAAGRATGLGFEDAGHAHLALAAALATKRQPDPEQAAAVAAQAVAGLAAYPTSSVASRAAEVTAVLTRDHRAVPAVRHLGDQLASLR